MTKRVKDRATPPARALEPAVLDAALLARDQDGADVEQGAAETDQTASDRDQAASERDDADAVSDQESADRDQATADQDHADDDDSTRKDAYASSRAERDASRVRRLATHGDRSATAADRLSMARRRDRAADLRDDIAVAREARARELEAGLVGSDRSLLEQLEQIRAQASADRARAAEDRARAASDRSAAAAERARLEAELYRAHLDALTGAFRRDMGIAALDLEIHRSRRGDGRFVLAFVDVDGLRQINNQAGHPAGDHVLQTLVRTMRSHLRSFDPIVRMGGDEFVAGLAGTALESAERRFEAIGQAMYADTGTRISVGLALRDEGETLAALTARADAILISGRLRRRAATN